MNINKRTFITFGLVAAVVATLALQSRNSETLKGQILENETTASVVNSVKPDLICLINAVNENGDVTVDVKLSNNGPGIVDGSNPFKYAIYIDEKEVFSNVDSYSKMSAGDSFQFSYPISKDIYQYSDSGNVKCSVDIDSAVNETNENNNTDTASY